MGMYVLCTISWPGGLIRFLLAPLPRPLARPQGPLPKGWHCPPRRYLPWARQSLLGYGTVLPATAEDAGRAVDMFSGYMWQLGLSGAHAYAKHNLGLGSLSRPGSPSVGGSSTPTSMSASMSRSGSVSTSGSRIEQEFVRRECEFARFLSPMSVYIAYIRILSRFYTFIPFPFPLRFLFLVVY